jgi:UDP-glucose 4-epimerase
MKNYCLVTGATGFLGRSLVNLLRTQGYRVRILTRDASAATGLWSDESVDVVVGQWGNNPNLYAYALENIDTVFHLAGLAHTDTSDDQFRLINCDASLALAQQAEKMGVNRFVYVSSTKAMADPLHGKRDESWTNWPTDPYGYWKRMAEKRLLEEINIPHLSVIRPCLIYGSGVKGNLLSMLQAIQKGYFPPLPATLAERSMVEVNDVARALLLLAFNTDANKKVFIAADGQAYTADGIYRAMRQALGLPMARWHVPLVCLRAMGVVGSGLSQLWPQCPINSNSINKLIAPAAYSAANLCNLGWQPTVTLYDVLPAMVETLREAAP